MSKIMFNRKRNVHAEFSNFHIAEFTYDGIVWNSVEAAFQAQKTLDLDERKLFASLTPGQAKARGRKVKLREDWEQVKYNIMFDICLAKFSQNKYLKEELLGTGDALIVEDSTAWHDNIWGCCRCQRCRNSKSRNNTGVVLMKVRSRLAGKPIPAKFTLGDKEVTFDFDSEEFKNECNTTTGIRVFNHIYRYAK